MLIADCAPNSIARPAAAKRANGSSVAAWRGERAQHDEGEQRDQDQAEHDAELLRRDREDEVGMALGQDALDRALARPAARTSRRAGRTSIAMSMLKVSPEAGSRKRWMRRVTCGTVK